jgi:hypothetical protein
MYYIIGWWYGIMVVIEAYLLRRCAISATRLLAVSRRAAGSGEGTARLKRGHCDHRPEDREWPVEIARTTAAAGKSGPPTQRRRPR